MEQITIEIAKNGFVIRYMLQGPWSPNDPGFRNGLRICKDAKELQVAIKEILALRK